MHLSIISPLAVKEYKISWLELETPIGNFVIQPEHAPTVLTLAPNKMLTFCLSNGKVEEIFVEAGIVEITRKTVTILLQNQS